MDFLGTGKALLSVPAVLGAEYGTGFACATSRGSQNNDSFVLAADAGAVEQVS